MLQGGFYGKIPSITSCLQLHNSKGCFLAPCLRHPAILAYQNLPWVPIQLWGVSPRMPKLGSSNWVFVHKVRPTMFVWMTLKNRQNNSLGGWDIKPFWTWTKPLYKSWICKRSFLEISTSMNTWALCYIECKSIFLPIRNWPYVRIIVLVDSNILSIEIILRCKFGSKFSY